MKPLHLSLKLFISITTALTFAAALTHAQTQPSWSIVPTPNPSTVRNLLRGISGTDSSDIWAVGHYQPNPANLVYQNLMLHWNGSAWQTVSVPNPSTTNSDLFDVKAINHNLAWAVGNAASGSVAGAEILKWNGSTWTQESIPAIPGGSYLFGVHALHGSDVWAVGGKAGSPFRCYAMHFNGSSWSEVAVPPVGAGRNNFNAVHGIAANDVWAVGTWGVAVGDYHFLAMHWDGSTWTNSPIPTSVNGGVDGELVDVKVVSANDVWAVGYSLAGGVVVVHFDGTAWTQVSAPGGGGALAVLDSNDIYAVGGEITHWDGSSWTIDTTLISYPWPALGAATVLPDGQIWAAGRTVDSNNVFNTLVYKRGATRASTPPPPTVVNSLSGQALSARVYPNPFSHSLSININADKNMPFAISLADMRGNCLLSKAITVRSGQQNISLADMPELKSGVYLLQLKAPDFVWTTRLVKN